MKQKDVPFWLIILVTLTIISISFFGFLMAQDRIGINPANQVIAFAFLIPAFAAGIYAIGIGIDDYKEKKFKKSSMYKASKYQDALRDLGKRRRLR